MKQLLFVDDEVRVLDGLRGMLRTNRKIWECHFATNVDEALDISGKIDLDAIVTDINMPGKTGIELLHTLRQDDQKKFLPILMLTGNNDAAVKREAFDLGVTDFLTKPFDGIDLVARLQNVLAMKGFQDEIRIQNKILDQRIAERTIQLEHSRRDILFRLAKAGEIRDADTGEHIVRVGITSGLLAKALGYDEIYQEQITIAAPLHDVGKIGISDSVLRKPGPLSPLERQAVQEHCVIGAKILSENLGQIVNQLSEIQYVGFENHLLTMAATIALHHHETWDGRGYPYGLSGEDIPIEA